MRNTAPDAAPDLGWVAARHVLPGLLDGAHRLQDRAGGRRLAALAVLHADAREFRGDAAARRLCRACLEQHRGGIGLDGAGPAAGGPCGLRHGVLPSRRTRGTLLWMLSNKFMPAVGVLVPIYLMLVAVGWLDTPHRRCDRDHLVQPTCRSSCGCSIPISRKCRSRSSRRRGSTERAADQELPAAAASVRARASPRPPCSRSSWRGTNPSGASTSAP